MIPSTLLAVAAGILSSGIPQSKSADKAPATPKTVETAAPETVVKKSAYTDVTAPVVKISISEITLKVSEVVPNGYTTKHVHLPGHKTATTIQVPKTKVVHNDVTIAIASTVSVKTISGKAAALTDIKAGETVRVHVTKVREAKPGEKYEAHLEVTKIDVPNTPPAKSSSDPKPKK